MLSLLTALVVFVVFMVAVPSRDNPDHKIAFATAAALVALAVGLWLAAT